MADNETRDWIIKLQADKQAAQQTISSVEAVRKRAQALREEVRSLTRDTTAMNVALKRSDSSALASTTRSLVEASNAAQQARRYYSEVNAGLDDLRRQALAADSAVGSLHTTIQKQPTSTAQTYGRAGTSLSAIGSAVGAVGGTGVQQALGTGGDVLRAVQGVQLLSRDLPQLAKGLNLSTANVIAMTAAVVAVGAAYVVAKDNLDEWNASADEARQKTLGIIGATREYQQFISTATSEELRAKAEEVAQKKAANDQIIADLLALQQQIESGVETGAGPGLTNAAENAIRYMDSLGIKEFGLQDVKDAITEVGQENAKYGAGFEILTNAFVSGATAANDAAARQEEATARQIAAIERDTQVRIDTAQLIATSSTASIQERLAAIQVERDSYQKTIEQLEPLAGASDEAAQKLTQARDQVFLLTQEEERLRTQVLPLVAAREQEAVAIAKIQAAYGAGGIHGQAQDIAPQLKAQAAVQKVVDDYAQQSAESQAKRQLTLLRDQEDFERKQAQDLAAHYADLAKIDQDYYERQAQLLEDLAAVATDAAQEEAKALADQRKEQVRAAEDHANRMLEIQRSLNQSLEGAVESRDVTAAIQAVRAAKQQAEDENKQYQQEKKRRDEDFNDRLREMSAERDEKLAAGRKALEDLKRQHDRERAASIAAFQDQRRRAAEEQRLRVQRQQQDWLAEDQARLKHAADQLGITQTAFANLNAAASLGMANFNATVSAYLASLITSVGGSIPASLIQQSVGGALGASLPKYGAGGMPRPGTWGIVGDKGPEPIQFLGYNRIYPSSALPSLGSVTVHAPITISGAGDSARDLEAVFEQRILPKLTRAVQQAARGTR